jgi:3-methylcrotonyl-CoA carboxylase alpha subunit
MFSSVLIANRGEIAVRVARTAKRLGLRTIAVYSAADAASLHVRACDEAHAIGAAPARESYLAIDRLIEVAKRTKADCIHPGYGFLSENADFAQACADAGIVFVGPPPAAIRTMGLKHRAKALMEKAGVPVIPGFHGERQDAHVLKQQAAKIGYPVLIKAVAGGGGRGMRLVERAAEFEPALDSARREARVAFGEEGVLIERYIDTPRHIEMQIFADRHGNVIHLNERDCSLQRRYQKVIEEAPAPGMTAEVRAAMGRAAIETARAVNYVGAGTVEFIADGARGLKPDGFWFMEMNTRLQVEHAVTEAITTLDLIEWQFRVAAGEPIPLRQQDVPRQGHAVEARLYAEDPEKDFLPSTAKIIALDWPAGDGIRIDTGVEQGSEVTPYYDPMIAKVIAHAATRVGALDRLASALEHTLVAGPRTNLAFLAALCRSDEFRAGHFDTGFITRNLAALGAVPRDVDRAAAALGVARLIEHRGIEHRDGDSIVCCDDEQTLPSPWDATDGFQLYGTRAVSLPIIVDGAAMTAQVSYRPDGPVATIDGVAAATDAVAVDGEGAVHVLRAGHQTVVKLKDVAAIDMAHLDDSGIVGAPMHGKVLAVLVEPGAKVVRGQRVALIEAMKMEHTLVAPVDGIVAEVAARVGDQLAEGAGVLRIEVAKPQ